MSAGAAHGFIASRGRPGNAGRVTDRPVPAARVMLMLACGAGMIGGLLWIRFGGGVAAGLSVFGAALAAAYAFGPFPGASADDVSGGDSGGRDSDGDGGDGGE